MIQFRVKEFKSAFFDRGDVSRAMDKATKKNLSKFGAFVRTDARGTIRKRKKASAPGTPPSSHTGLLKKFLFFGFDQNSRSVVIGPARLNKPGMAPQALEYGGTSVAVRKRQTNKGAVFARQPIRIAPRPFMGPAFTRTQARLPEIWKNSIR